MRLSSRFACVMLPVLLTSVSLRTNAAEVTLRNDSLANFGAAVIVSGFTGSEAASSWLTSSCGGNIRAVQVFWRSQSGSAAPGFGQAINIYRAGTFPVPGALAESIIGPVMSDGVLNEFRFLDENNSVPLMVPVSANETFVVSYVFDEAPPAVGPSVVRDTDGCQAGRNGLLAQFGGGLSWFSSCALGVSGDWVIRAVVDCATGAVADLTLSQVASTALYLPGQTVSYTITLGNGGASPVPSARVVDTFAASLSNVSWSCSASAGASCPSPSSGTDAINVDVGLPVGSSAVFSVNATVAAGSTGVISNTASIIVPAGFSDPNLNNNTQTTSISPDALLRNGFE